MASINYGRQFSPDKRVKYPGEIKMAAPILDLHLNLLTMENNKFSNLEDRLVKFAIMCLDVCDKLPDTKTGKNVGDQLSKSGIAPALIYSEVQAAKLHDDFILKMKLVVKELRETRINLRIINEKPTLANENAVLALKECNEFLAIFSKSIETSKKNHELKKLPENSKKLSTVEANGL
jgi:four helix bundle protein